MSGMGDMYRTQAMLAAAGDNKEAVQQDLMMASMFDNMERQQREADEERRREEEREHQRQLERQRIEAENRRLEEERRRREAIERQQAFDNFMAHGSGFAANKVYDAALNEFEQALRLFPNDAMAAFNKAICLKNLEQYKPAYDQFLKLSGHANDVPGLDGHISFCKDRLMEISSHLYEEAQKAYQAGNTKQAKKTLNDLNGMVPISTEGKQLKTLSNELLKQIEWDGLRSKTLAAFNEGYGFLQQEQFEKALDRFKHCATNFKEYSKFLTQQEQMMLNDLTNLTAQANRGIERLNNVHLQNAINQASGELRTHLKNFEVEEAFKICSSMLQKCHEITKIEDVAHLGYISIPTLDESMEQLNQYMRASNQRKADYTNELRSCVTKTLEERSITLSEDHLRLINNAIDYLVKNNWQNLDNRDLSEITRLFGQTLTTHCQEHNVCAKCCAGVSHYFDSDDANQTYKTFDEVVKANIPVDTRRPIQLEMFKATATAKAPLGFSSYMTGANAPQSMGMNSGFDQVPQAFVIEEEDMPDLNLNAETEKPAAAVLSM